jgi:hypothetical protein
MLKSIASLFLILLANSSIAQKPLVWELLALTTYTNSQEEEGSLIPNFPPILISQYEGEEVSISGYLVPIDVATNKYALSKNPFSSCFFCGNAGPETVIELRFEADPGRFVTDEYLMIKGVLQLNHKGDGLFFTLKNASLHG